MGRYLILLMPSGCAVCTKHPVGCTAAIGVAAVAVAAAIPHRHGRLTCGSAMHGDVLLPPGADQQICQ